MVLRQLALYNVKEGILISYTIYKNDLRQLIDSNES